MPTHWLDALTQLSPRTWLRAGLYSCVAALAIAIPADLIDNRLFGRPVAPRTIDYVVLTVTAALIGLVLAIRPEQTVATESQEKRAIFSGVLSFFAVGCPVCNQAVVALVGTSGALSWWAPAQPVVGLIAIGVLLFTLRQRLDTYQLAACPI